MFAKLASNLNVAISAGWNFFRPRKKLGLVSFVLLSSAIITAWFVFTPGAHAAGVADTLLTFFAKIFLDLAGFFIKLTFFVLKFVIEVAGYNGFIDSPAVTVGWVIIRDMTNMFFVVVLLAIAFGTILGIESYEYKHLLVKLLIAAVVVNFSRVICGLIIDVAQIVMITFVNGIAATASGNLVNMFQVDKIFKLSASAGTGGTGSATFLAGVAALAFSVIMLVTMFAFLAMIVARMAMLWVLIVLSPLAFVLNVLHQTEKYAHDWWHQFGNNVISGPIIAFFLWLSFVTVGSGTIHDDIVQHNALQKGQLLQAGTAEEETVGITDIMSWDKMANFIIAIAMLLAGAKMAQELGVAGGGMMASAGELGKKVAMYASGLQAARWTAGKMGEGAKAAGKFALMKAPLGGEFWKRKGEKIAYKAKFKWGQLNERRSEKAVSLEQDRKRLRTLEKKKKLGTLKGGELKEYENLTSGTGKLKRMGSWFAARLIEPAGRDEKRVKDWKVAAENQEELVAETYSVSEEDGGIAKTNSGRRLHNIEELAEAKKHLKEAKEEGRLRSRAKMIHLDHEIHEDEEKEEELEHKIDGEQNPEKKKKREEELAEVRRRKEMRTRERIERLDTHKKKYSEDFTGANFDDKKYLVRMDKAEEAHAQSDLIKKDIDKEKELELARIKDKELVKKGELPRYESATRASQQKDLEDQWNTLTYRELTEQARIFAEQMANLAKAGKANTPEYREKAANAAAVMSATTKKGAEFGMAAIDGAAGAAGFKEDVRAGDMEAMQRKVLSGLLGRNVDGKQYKLEDAVRDFSALHGEQTFAILRNLSESLKQTAKDGGINVAGLLNDKTVDEKGRVKFRFNGFDERGNRSAGKQATEDQKHFVGERAYWASENVISKIANLTDMLTKQADGNLGAPIDPQGMEQFVTAFKSMTRSTKLHSRLLEQFSGMLKDKNGKMTSQIQNQDLKKSMQELFTTFLQRNREAAKAMLGKLGDFTQALASDNAEIMKAVNETKSEVKGNNIAEIETAPE